MTNYQDDMPVQHRTRRTLKLAPQWMRVVKAMEKGTVVSSLSDPVAANSYVRRSYRYQPDIGKDYWKTPDEFEQDNGGDCEDFAIYHYFKLATKAKRYIAVGTLKNTGEHHAVLVIEVDGDWMVLDNMTDHVISYRRFCAMFVPMYLCDTEGVYI